MRALILALLLSLTALAAAMAQTTTSAPPVTQEYRLGAGDVLRINVYQNPDLTLEARLTESGFISYPLLGAVQLGGLTIAAAEKRIADGLRSGNFVRQPQVSLVLMQVRGHQASVLGQVNRPGRFALEQADTRLTDLLALAGGATTTAADVVVVSGVRNGQPFNQRVDLPMLFRPGSGAPDLIMQNGDVVWVDRQPMVYIYGEVQRPGTFRLERDMTLLQGLASGGGLTQRGTEKGIRVHRKRAEGGVDIRQPQMDEKLQDGDVIYVRESLF